MLRKMSIEEHDRTRILWEEVFSDDTPKFLDYYYSEVAKIIRYTICTVEDGAIQSMLHLNPYPTYIEGQGTSDQLYRGCCHAKQL